MAQSKVVYNRSDGVRIDPGGTVEVSASGSKLLDKFSNLNLSDLAQTIHEFKVAPLSMLVAAFLKSNNKVVSAGNLYAIVSLYTEAPPISTITEYSMAFKDISALFSLWQSLPEQSIIIETAQKQCMNKPDATEYGSVSYDPKTGYIGLIKSVPTGPAKQYLENNTFLVKLITGAVALLCTIFGIHGARSFSVEALCDSVRKCGSFFVGAKNSITTISSILDSILPGIYTFFGAEYISDSHRMVRLIADKVDALYKDTQDVMMRAKIDYFGLQYEHVNELEARLEGLEKLYRKLSETERSLYNFNQRSSLILSAITELRNIIVDLYKSSGGKQRPVVIWVAGQAGIGKTKLSVDFSNTLAGKHNGSVFCRNSADQYWPNYRGQTVCNMDDLLQIVNGEDVIEFHRYTSEEQKDVISAAVEQKGTPFTSRYMVCTSNKMWFAPPSKMTDYLALNRRRDICIYAWNPAVAKYRSEHNGMAPDDEDFFKQNPTRYFLYNPTYGATLERSNLQDTMVFSPDAEWVVREVSVDEVKEGAYELQQYRAEMFRQRLVALGKRVKYAPPSQPIPYNKDKFIHTVKTRAGVATFALPSGDSFACDLEYLNLHSIDERLGVSPDVWEPLRGVLHARYNINLKTINTEHIVDVIEKIHDYGLLMKEKPALWIAHNGDLAVKVGDRRWDEAEIARYVKKKEIFHTPCDVIDLRLGENVQDVEYELLTPRAPVQGQSAPTRREKRYINVPAVLVMGPPGCGKTFACHKALDNLYEPTFEKDEVIPKDRPILLDDITTSLSRFRKCKEIIWRYYQRSDFKFVVATLNCDTAVWNSLSSDDRTMLQRRCHVLNFDYSRTTRVTAWLRGIEPAEYLKQEQDRDAYLTAQFTLYPNRDPGFYALTPCMSALEQVLKIECKASLEPQRMFDYQCLELPMPEKPALKVLLDSSENPSWTGTRMMILRDGEYKPPRPAESMEGLKLFTILRNKFSTATIADRSMAPAIVNREHIPNTTGIKSAVIIAPDWAIGIETADDTLVAYLISESPSTYYPISSDSYMLDGVTYVVEDKYDLAMEQLIARNAGVVSQISDEIRQKYEYYPEDINEILPQTPVLKFVHQLVAVADIAATVAFGGYAIADALKKEQVPIVAQVDEEEPREERRRREQKKNPDQSDSSAADKNRVARTKYEGQEPEEERKKRPQARADHVDGSANVKQRPAQNKYESAVQALAVAYESEPPTGKESNLAMTLVRIGNEDDCEFGVLYDGHVTYATELPPESQKWIVFRRPIDAFKKEVTQLLKGKNVHDAAIISALTGKHLCLPPDATADLSSMLATYVCFGEPRDFTTNKVETELFKPIMSKLPFPRHTLSRQQQDAQVESFQGCVDSQAMKTLKLIHANRVQILDSEGQFAMSGIMLHNDVGMTNNHAPKKFKIQDGDSIYPVEVLNYSTSNDVLLFRVTDKKYTHKRDITKYVITQKELTTYLSQTGGRMAVALGLAQPELMVVTGGAECSGENIESVDDYGSIRVRTSIGYFGQTGVTEYGDCGSPLVLMCPSVNSKFIGIHSRGTDLISISSPITREYLRALEKGKDEGQKQSQRLHPDIEYESARFQCQDTGLTQIGKPAFPVHAPTTTTSYRSGLRIEPLHEPTIKNKSDPRNVDKRDMLLEGIARYGSKAVELGTEHEIIDAAEEIGEYLASLMDAEELPVRLLTNTEAINGAPHVEYPTSRSIDRKGSAGYPLTQRNPTRPSKQDYLYQNERNGLWYFRDDAEAQRVLSSTNRLIEDARQGMASDVAWIAYSKDEPVKLKKIYDISSQKTRVFFAGQFDYLLAYRRLFGAALWRITELHNLIPVRVGLRTVSLEWQNLAYQHAKISKKGFDSDMENWDGTVPLAFLQAVTIVYNRIYQRCDPGWTPSDDEARTTLHKAVEGAIVIVRDRVYKLDQAMASGFPGTAVENSLINWMLFYCCWKRILLRTRPEYANFNSFMKYSCLSVFGDDNICTVNDVLSPHFNYNTFKIEAAKFGFKVTDAAKSGLEMPDVRPLEELEFLKRGFKKQGWMYVPTLDEVSINKTLCWIAGSPSYYYTGLFRTSTDSSVFEESLNSLWTEMALHGEERYVEFARDVVRAAKGTGIRVSVPRYDELRRQAGF